MILIKVMSRKQKNKKTLQKKKLVNDLLETKKKLNIDSKELKKCIDINCGNDTITYDQQKQLMKECNLDMKCVIKKDNKFGEKLNKRLKCSKIKCKTQHDNFDKSFSKIFNQYNKIKK